MWSGAASIWEPLLLLLYAVEPNPLLLMVMAP
jgi:hypothetical protein